MHDAVHYRFDVHERMLAAWRKDLGKKLAALLPQSVDEPTVTRSTGDVKEDGSNDSESDYDDKSSMYTEASEREDEPAAEEWDELEAEDTEVSARVWSRA